MPKYYPKSQIISNLYAADGVNNRVNGTLLLITTKEPYTGFFWSTSDRKYYTGKTPSDRPGIELIIDESTNKNTPLFSPLNPVSKIKSTLAFFTGDPEVEIRGLVGPTPSGNPNWGWNQLDNLRYATVKGVSLNTPPEYDNPYTNPVVPSDTDYKLGSFYRYFAKKRNANIYIETDKNMYDDIVGKSNNVTYFEFSAFRILWTLTGHKDHVKQVNKNSVDLVARTLNVQGLDKFLAYDYLKYYKS